MASFKFYALTTFIVLIAFVSFRLRTVVPKVVFHPSSSPFNETLPTKSFINVLGKRLAFIEQGEITSSSSSSDTPAIVFLHGNPTSSYLWRNVIPHVTHLGKVFALDLIGMGDSDKLDLSPGENPDLRYSLLQHKAYLAEFLNKVLLPNQPVILVLHDWGSALGFDWARENEARVKAIVYMEAIVDTFGKAPLPFQVLRSTFGDPLVLQYNAFIEVILPMVVERALSEKEMENYRKPYLNAGEDRRPTLTWPREVPFNGEPKHSETLIKNYSKWLKTTHNLPKLFINANPGTILIGPYREYAQSLPNQKEVTVKGLHFIQEDSPNEIGQAIAEFIKNL